MNQVFTFNDLIKDKVLNMFEFGKINYFDIITVLVISLLLSMFIFVIYKKTYRGVSYNNSFNITLILMCLITSIIILTISSNVVLSLGMVGALSIVRFRTPIKEPLDIVFLFWAIAIGISTGARFFQLSILGTLFVGIVIFIATKITYESDKYLLIINCNKSSLEEIFKNLSNKKHIIKSKSVTLDSVELTLEINIKDKNLGFTEDISTIAGVSNLVLVKASISSEL